MTESVVHIAFDGPVATLTLDRRAKHNALSQAMWSQLSVRVAEACARPETRVIVLRGAGGNFAAGADIAEFDQVFADRAAGLSYLHLMIHATAAIAQAPVPVIAAIEGLCIGAGVAVALACDLRIADAGASFAITPAKLGLLYSLTDTRRLVAVVGPSRAKDLLFTGGRIDAARALAWGLIDTIGDAEAVTTKARAIASLSSWTHAHTKRVIAAIERGQAEEDDETRGWFADAARHDFGEGVAAFRVRRAPMFPERG